MSTYLAVDQSTSATKALLFSEMGELLDQESLSHRQIYPQPGWVEHDAEEIYRSTVQVLGDLAARHAGQGDEIISLSITNQRETFVIFDRESGRPLHPAIVWLCRRGEPLCRQLVEAGHEPLVHERTGLKIDTYFPASKVAWLLQERPDLAQALANGDALFGTIDTYLVYRLTGGAVYASDHTNASRTLFYDIGRMAWDPELAELFGVKVARWPELRESCAQFGETDLEGRLQRKIPICGVIGDSQAALFAQRCYEPGSAKVTIGTGSSILMNIGGQKVLSPRGVVTAVAWALGGQPTYAFEGIINYTGGTIAWLRDQLELIDSPDETEALAQSVPDNGGVYLVPAFAGLSAPYWRSDVRATIMGLSPASTRQHVVRAALESIAYVITDALRLMEEDSGITLQHIYADGGAVRNRFLMQFLADISRRTVRVPRLPELSALGAVFNAMIGMRGASLEDLQRLPIGHEAFEPSMSQEAAEALYAGWQRAVQQVLT